MATCQACSTRPHARCWARSTLLANFRSRCRVCIHAAPVFKLKPQSSQMPTRIFLILLLVAQPIFAQLPLAKPESVSVSASRLAAMDSVINDEISKGKLPGAVVFVGRKGKLVWQKAYGSRAVDPAREPMTTDTIFDVASLTKVVATATSIMILVDRGKIRLQDPVSKYIPELK